MRRRVSIAVVGAGLIGRRHVDAIIADPSAELLAIVDPMETAGEYARSTGAAWHPSLSALFDHNRPDGVVIATPNQTHVEIGSQCIAAGIPALIEKPLATDVSEARALVEAGERAGVPLLAGHHRRHNPLMAAAKAKIAEGALGRLVSVHGMFWLMKPDDYFDAGWRRRPGAGPIFLNLIHDVDLLRYLVGEIDSVQALDSNAIRGNQVEESTVILLRFENGVLGTLNASDTIVAPWSWELTAEENPAYPRTGQSCYHIGGTHGSMELPKMRIWTNSAKRSWWEPISATHFPVGHGDPLNRQIGQFVNVVLGEEPPLVPAREGLKTLEVIDAIKRSASTGAPVFLNGARQLQSASGSQ